MKNSNIGEYSHRIGEFVSYKSNGICRISDIITQDFGGLGDKVYYEMKMVFDEKTVIYVPVDSPALEAGMRHILSKEEIDSIISRAESADSLWIENPKERNVRYTEILAGEDKCEVLRIIRALNAHKDEVEECGKKMYANDLKILAAAEKIITEEFAFGLGIERDEAVPYILKRISDEKEESSAKNG